MTLSYLFLLKSQKRLFKITEKKLNKKIIKITPVDLIARQIKNYK